jgi:glycerol-3-phosphate dehydrogenase
VRRDLDRLGEPFDLVVIGAGIYGAAIAWDATLRGFRVALIDRGDLGGGTSFNNAKTLHGGVRSLQGLRLGELREYVRERRALMRIAPHLVRPLTFVSPALGTLTRNALAYFAYFRAYDALAWDRNAGLPAHLQLAPSRVLERDAYLALDPLSDPARVTGGVAWQDGQMVHGDRLTLAFAKSAAARGALVANYLRADRAIVDGGTVRGLVVTDIAPAADGSPAARSIEVAARLVVNAAGPYADRVAAQLLGRAVRPLVPMVSLGLNVVIGRPLGLVAAVGGVARGRLFFAAPWRQGTTIAGTSHEPYDGDPDAPTVPPDGVDVFLRDFNTAFPRARLTRDDVRLVHRGLLPTRAIVKGEVRLLKTSVIRDHAADGHPGLLSVVGTRYTTARHTAARAVDRACARLDHAAPPCATAVTPLAGALAEEHVDRLERLYGTDAEAVRALAAADARLAEPLAPGCATLGAEVAFATRRELALTLADAILRRTEAGATGAPSRAALERAAAIMGGELGWPAPRTAAEIAATERVYDVP